MNTELRVSDSTRLDVATYDVKLGMWNRLVRSFFRRGDSQVSAGGIAIATWLMIPGGPAEDFDPHETPLPRNRFAVQPTEEGDVSANEATVADLATDFDDDEWTFIPPKRRGTVRLSSRFVGRRQPYLAHDDAEVLED